MTKFLKLTLLSTLFVITILSSAKAAFPTLKEATENVVANELQSTASAETSEKSFNNVQNKKELKSFLKQNHRGGSGGKSKILAAVLAFFLGGFGIHSFYMGQSRKGFIQLGGTLLGIALFIIGALSISTGESLPILAIIGYLLILGVGIWAFIDFIRILTGGLEPEEGFDS